MRGILDNLFDFGRTRDDTPGEALHFRIWELFIGFQAVRYAWLWGWESLRITDVVLPLGIARYVDIGHLIGGPLPLVNAGLLTALVGLGFPVALVLSWIFDIRGGHVVRTDGKTSRWPKWVKAAVSAPLLVLVVVSSYWVWTGYGEEKAACARPTWVTRCRSWRCCRSAT